MINCDKPHLWKDDVFASVRMYNEWFLAAAPEAFKTTRVKAIDEIERLMLATNDMRDISPALVKANPSIINGLRMSTSPPLARDRLAGLATLPSNSLLKALEGGSLPPRMARSELDSQLDRICAMIARLLDADLFPWLANGGPADERQRELAATVVADRLCGAVADPIVRNAQEQRQLALIESWLLARGYRKQNIQSGRRIQDMDRGTFSFRQNVIVRADTGKPVNIPVDTVIMPPGAAPGSYPVLIEAKSAGDFTNTNKRRKEEATKVRQLKDTYGESISLTLFLCGYFDAGYLGYEAAEGIDWVWEHRIDDMEQLLA